MPLPLFLGVLAGVTGVLGVGSSIHGAAKMKEANDIMELAKSRHGRNLERCESRTELATKKLDEVGKKELEILKSFAEFSDIIEKIQNKPEFKGYNKENINIPKLDIKELKEVSIGAGVLLGGISGAALGTAGGFAAAGATTAAVTALGTASTGTAIASLSGAAATNATLAALGGGSLAAGGGGIALGSTILGASTLGVGLLVGGVIFNLVGGSLVKKADEAWKQMLESEEKVDCICLYLSRLYSAADRFNAALKIADDCYQGHLRKLRNIVDVQYKRNWNYFTNDEKCLTENTILLVGLLFSMCKVKFVVKNYADKTVVNEYEINKKIKTAEITLSSIPGASITWSPITWSLINEEAKELYEKGKCYEKGIGVEKSFENAVKCYRKSADQGYVEAQKKMNELIRWGGISGRIYNIK